MSYSFKIVKQGQTMTVEGATDHAPDGTWTVNGHEDTASRSVSVGRYDPDGSCKVMASGMGTPVPATPEKEVSAGEG